MARLVYLGVGWLFVGLGGLGVVLPLVPTTPFLLVALWAFAKSSRRFHDWLYTHPRWGPTLGAWRDHGVISRRTKLTAVSVMTATLLYAGLVARPPAPALAAMGALMAVGAGFILTRPSTPRAKAGPEPSPDR